MSSPALKLQRVRGIFVVYFVLKSVIGAAVAAAVLNPARLGRLSGSNLSGAALFFFSLAVTATVLAVALLVFARLLERRNWARVLLLVIGWLTVFSAVFSLLSSAQLGDMGSRVARWLPEWDWQKLVNFDRVQKVFEFLFWGYLIAVLQFDEEVKKEFFPPTPVEKGPEN
jgi:glucan phosphoethanolaminetransferase (alkaline phosphatase superfamily)